MKPQIVERVDFAVCHNCKSQILRSELVQDKEIKIGRKIGFESKCPKCGNKIVWLDVREKIF